jgi:hypothetical protein
VLADNGRGTVRGRGRLVCVVWPTVRGASGDFKAVAIGCGAASACECVRAFGGGPALADRAMGMLGLPASGRADPDRGLLRGRGSSVWITTPAGGRVDVGPALYSPVDS